MCKVDDCEAPVRSRGLCNRHYLRLKRHGDEQAQLIQRYGPDAECSADDCRRRPIAKGFCKRHYERSAAPPLKPRPTEAERFWAKVDKSTDCWLWRGARTKRAEGMGYGQFRRQGGAQWTAHRVAWDLVGREIPDGLVLDHLCRVRLCVNPDHLEAVTPYENFCRGEAVSARSLRQTHCKRGHPLSGNNVRVESSGRRRCLTCKRGRY